MFDYVIVGAGSAGCVVAARLSEDPDVSVCVIEAGPPDTADNIHIPAAFGKLFRTQFDWDYSTHHEPFCDRRRIYIPRGRVLGGSSSMNAMIYIRGNRADYDEWGIEGWGYEDLLPYFLRAEDNERGAFSEFHGAGGPLTVSDGRSRAPGALAFVEAAVEAGHRRTDDFNGAAQDGVGEYQLTQRNGQRCSAAVAYLHPATGRPNLTIETYLQVHRVLFENGRAVGVAGQRLGGEIQIRAEREVIVAAGAYNSPHLLMHSGIGSAELLTLLQIPVVFDQPLVGQNLSDHPNCGIVYTHAEPTSLLTGMEPEMQQLFMDEGRGPLSSNVAEVGGFMRSRDDLPAPDLQFHAAAVMYADEGLGAATEHGFSLGTCVLKPRSRGSVLLASEDPTAKPVILHNYYAEPEDMDTAVAGLRAGMEIAAQEPLRRYTEAVFAGPASDSDEDLRAHVRQYAQTLYHPVGTCAMGSVVDAELRVTGVEALRVVDASVMPTVPRGNTNAPTIAIAERAADLIRGKVAAQPAAAVA